MEIEILLASTSKVLGKCQLSGIEDATVADVKQRIALLRPSLYADRQSIRLEARGKTLKDSDKLHALGVRNGSQLFVKDLGPQIGWTTVFLAEYAGPLAVYLWFYGRPSLVYGTDSGAQWPPMSQTAHIAAACYIVHYVKRLLETVFVHRFSHATMPIMNLFKNCSYYWGFTAYVAYHVNHPQFTSPCSTQVYAALLLFIISELGNFSIHLNLRNLRPPGTKVRKIPQPDWNPLTSLFNCVSCPNYTYEVSAWLMFSIMTQCLPAFLFAFAGFYQMAVWALGKHKNYRKEFKDYPKGRKAIVPYVL